MERLETDLTHCDGCQGDAWKQNPQPARKRCAKLGPDGHYTLALCADCYAPYAEQERSRELWLSVYSDTYKDLHGFRPRHDWMRTASAERLKAATQQVAKTLDEVLELERRDAEIAAALANNEPMSGEGWSYTPAS
jgi:hypothetical protein